MFDRLTQTQWDTAQKGASSASKSILPAVNIQVMALTYHGKACSSHATLSGESGSINYFQTHSIQFGYLEAPNNRLGNEFLYRPLCSRALDAPSGTFKIKPMIRVIPAWGFLYHSCDAYAGRYWVWRSSIRLSGLLFTARIFSLKTKVNNKRAFF
jgi:hypothetical protein